MKASVYSGLERRDWLRQRTLTIIIAIAFIVVTAIDFEQGRVIDAQQSLIRLLSLDSSELATRRIEDIQKHR